MARILIQQADAANMDQTLLKSVSLDQVQQFVSSDEYLQLSLIYPDGQCWMWGFREGKWNRKQWEAIHPGTEIAFFLTGAGAIVLFAHARFKVQSSSLANAVWPLSQSAKAKSTKESKAEPFEYVYFTSRPSSVAVTLAELNDIGTSKRKYEFTLQHPLRKSFFLQEIASDKMRAVLQPQVTAMLKDSEGDDDKIKLILSGGSISDTIFGSPLPPPIAVFADHEHATHVRHKDVDAFAWLKNSERRTLAHKELLDRVREKAKHLQVYRLILIDLVIAGAFIEIKSIEEDAVRQARSALAQLYHYKFVYREQYGDPALLAIFGKEPIAEGNNLSIFLAHCRIASAWWNRSANLFDGTAEAKRIAPWLFK